MITPTSKASLGRAPVEHYPADIMDEKHDEKLQVPELEGNIDRTAAQGGAVTRDGIQVHPQPTADSLDPLNWTSWRKHSILAIICFKYWLFTYITTTT